MIIIIITHAYLNNVILIIFIIRLYPNITRPQPFIKILRLKPNPFLNPKPKPKLPNINPRLHNNNPRHNIHIDSNRPISM